MLDHMNAILYGVPKYLLAKLQKIQNQSARIITRTRRSEHITPVLKNLHWLPIHRRIQYKILLTSFKALHGLAPGYLADLIPRLSIPRATRSQNLALLKPCPVVKQGKKLSKTFGERSFMYSAPKLWNRMPLQLREGHDLEAFKSNLKTHLFAEEYGS